MFRGQLRVQSASKVGKAPNRGQRRRILVQVVQELDHPATAQQRGQKVAHALGAKLDAVEHVRRVHGSHLNQVQILRDAFTVDRDDVVPR